MTINTETNNKHKANNVHYLDQSREAITLLTANHKPLFICQFRQIAV